MKNRMRIRLAVCALLVFAAASLYAQMPQPFSADMASSSPNGTKMNGKYYLSPPSYRIDTTIAESGRKAGPQNVSMIIDGNSKTTYMIMHDQKMYMEMHADQQNPFLRQAPFTPHDFDPNNPCVWAQQKGATSCKKLGTETVNGRVCDKYQGTSSDGKTGTGWIDQRLHVPIKWVSSDGATFDLTNVKEGKPDASLFQPPAGYRKIDMMGGGRPPR